MGNSATVASCTSPSTTREDIRLPFAVAQADSFACEDCPFCSYRASHCKWLRDEIKRLTSEVVSLETTIPPKFLPDLHVQLEDYPLPESMYTGGVEDIRGVGCTKCAEVRQEVQKLQSEARKMDAHCKARIEYHRKEALGIEELLIEKRRIEEKLYWGQPGPNRGDGEMDGHFCAITKVNQSDDISHHIDKQEMIPSEPQLVSLDASSV